MALDLRERLRGTLRQLVQSDHPRGNKSAQVVAIASSKGGVGKTTTAVNLATALARLGNRVLLIDLDPQAHVAQAIGLTLDVQKPPLSHVLLGHHNEVLSACHPTGEPGLQLAGSDKSLAETEMVLSAKIGKELILSDALRVTRSHYDAILIDCPPHLGTLTLNALCAADQLLIPSDMSRLALEGVSDILGAVDTVNHRLGRNLEVLGVLATRYDRRATRSNQEVTGSFESLLGDALFKTRIPQNSAVNQAHMAGQSVLDFRPSAPGAMAYRALADEVAARLGLQHAGAQSRSA